MKDVLICFSLFVLSSCNLFVAEDTLECALKLSKENRKELEYVLDFYKNGNDSLKYQAACFLISNMPGKYSIVPSMGKNDSYVHELFKTSQKADGYPWDKNRSILYQKLASIYRVRPPSSSKIMDINIITSEFLINNIESAFSVWDKKRCSFENFCEYILPYRIGTEPLSNWRSLCFERYSHYLDSSLSNHSICKHIIKDIVDNGTIKYNVGMSTFPYGLTQEDLFKIRWGDCNHMSMLLTSIFRSIGIPSTIDYTPYWANHASGHSWNVILDETGKTIDLGYKDEAYNNDFKYKLSKIYRRNFSIAQMDFSNDVTNEYDIPASKLQIKQVHSPCYLCTYQAGTPVAVATTQNGVFESVDNGGIYRDKDVEHYIGEGKGILYIICSIDKFNNHNQITQPFILHPDGRQEFLEPNKDTLINVVLKRKYPKYFRIANYESQVCGGQFEVADNPLFRNKRLLFSIDSIPPSHAINKISINNNKPFRYVRYVAKNDSMSLDETWTNISEIGLYYKGEKVSCNIINTQNQSVNPSILFDDNIDTYYYTTDSLNNCINIDLGSPKLVDEIQYCPRTDNNDIIPGEEYELFYWDRGWNTLGVKIADKKTLEYSNVPQGSLLMLHNRTRGIEERPFTYNNGEQIWW